MCKYACGSYYVLIKCVSANDVIRHVVWSDINSSISYACKFKKSRRVKVSSDRFY